MEKRLVDVVPALIANCEPAILRKPGQCTLHNPPVSAQLLAALYALPCYTAFYPASSEGTLALLIIVGFVGVQLLGTPPRSATGTLDGLYSVDELFEGHRIVNVGCGDDQRESDTPSVRNKVALRPLLSFICRIRSGLCTPLLAGMEAESSEARSQALQKNSVQPFPHARLMPFLQASPASHPRSAAHLLREHLPGDAALQHEDDARQSCPIVDARSSA